MNTTIEKIFEEIGRLHVQIQQHVSYIAQLEAQVKAYANAPAVVPAPVAPAEKA